MCCVAVAISAVAIVVLTARSGNPSDAAASGDAVAMPREVPFVEPQPASAATAASIDGTEHTRVLFIGNSYTLGNDLPGTISLLTEANGLKLDVGVQAKYGFSLAKHLEYATVTDELRNGDWDIVIIQELSIAPAAPALFEAQTLLAVDELVALAADAGTDVVFFQTWGHRSGNPEIDQPDYESMQQAVIDSYARLSELHDATVAPVGRVWGQALRDYPELNLYVADGTHPSPTGSYLAALTIARTLVGAPLHTAEPIGVGQSVADLLLDLVNEATVGQ